MIKRLFFLIFLSSFLISNLASAQVNEDKLGAWYMYLWNTTFKEINFGLQGDVQYRN